MAEKENDGSELVTIKTGDLDAVVEKRVQALMKQLGDATQKDLTRRQVAGLSHGQAKFAQGLVIPK